MAEALINYGIFFIVILILLVITTVIKRSKILTNIFSSIGKLLSILLNVVMLIIFTICISLLVAMIITIHPFVFGNSQFFFNGEAIHFLATDDLALLSFSLTYGVLYVIGFFICLRLIVRSRVGKFFYTIAKKIRQTFQYGYRKQKDRIENRIMTTASQLMISTILLFIYPIIMNFFPNISMTFGGSLLLFIVLFIFSMFPLPNKTNQRQEQRQKNYRNRADNVRMKF